MSEATRIGAVLAGYRVESLLGRGGMSVVYLAEHVRLGRKVALKVLASPLAHDESFRERFTWESQRAAGLDHPNVIPIYDAGEIDGGDADGLLYIAMRYVDGSDLRSLLKREGRLGVGRTLYMIEQVASALDAAHDRDLIHRDVKPSNILIAEPSEHVYLTDFGVAKQTTAPDLTRTGIFVGTIEYAAPEQIEGLTLDRRTDVYALGCVLYECLAGRPPFEREAEVAVMHAHLTSPPPRLTDARPDLPKDLDRVIARAMAKSRDERFGSTPELIDAVHAVLRRSPAASSPPLDRHEAPVVPVEADPAGESAPVAETVLPPEPAAPAVAQADVPVAAQPSAPAPDPAPPPATGARGSGAAGRCTGRAAGLPNLTTGGAAAPALGRHCDPRRPRGARLRDCRVPRRPRRRSDRSCHIRDDEHVPEHAGDRPRGTAGARRARSEDVVEELRGSEPADAGRGRERGLPPAQRGDGTEPTRPLAALDLPGRGIAPGRLHRGTRGGAEGPERRPLRRDVLGWSRPVGPRGIAPEARRASLLLLRRRRRGHRLDPRAARPGEPP